MRMDQTRFDWTGGQTWLDWPGPDQILPNLAYEFACKCFLGFDTFFQLSNQKQEKKRLQKTKCLQLGTTLEFFFLEVVEQRKIKMRIFFLKFKKRKKVFVELISTKYFFFILEKKNFFLTKFFLHIYII